MKKEQVKDNQETTQDFSEDKKAQATSENASQSDNVAEGVAEEGDNEQPVAQPEVDWKDRYMRLSAEFDNFRKRTLKEKMDLMEYGGEGVIKSFLKVIDDYDRAVAAMQKSDDIDAIKQGIMLIHNKMTEVLKENNVVEIEAMGKELDTDFHDAIAKVPSDEKNKGLVIDVVEKGYTLKEKVIRYSKVVVGE